MAVMHLSASFHIKLFHILYINIGVIIDESQLVGEFCLTFCPDYMSCKCSSTWIKFEISELMTGWSFYIIDKRENIRILREAIHWIYAIKFVFSWITMILENFSF